MSKSVLCIHSGTRAKQLQNRFNDPDITFYAVSSAAEAIDILKQHDIMVVLVDYNISGMNQMDFIKYSVRSHPNTMLNVCLDITDPNVICNVANIAQVKKIYLSSWDMYEAEEGIRSTIDQMLIETDYREKRKAMEDAKAEMESAIENLKGALHKQRFSYNRLAIVLKPYLEEVIRSTSADDDLYYNLVRRTCEKMLRVMTTSKLSTEKLELYMTEDITRGLPQSGRIKLKKIESCITGERSKDKIAQVIFAVWLICTYQSYRLQTGDVTITSSYINASRVRFEVDVFGEENTKCPESVHEYVREIAEYVCQGYAAKKQEGQTKYILDLDI